MIFSRGGEVVFEEERIQERKEEGKLSGKASLKCIEFNQLNTSFVWALVFINT